MNKIEKIVFTAALAHAFCSVVAMKAQQEELNKYKDYHRRMQTWSGILNEIMDEHFSNGGHLRISPEMEAKLDAYMIFRANNMV